MNFSLITLFIGVGATAVMDLWGLARKPLLGIAPPNYALVGRWIAHMTHGRFRHDSIAASAPVRGEHILGWTAHYLIGIAFAALLIGIWGFAWVRHPTIGPALAVGIGSRWRAFPPMQPGGLPASPASRTPRPASARPASLITHAVFGLGLYAAGQVVHLIPQDETQPNQQNFRIEAANSGESNAYSRSFCTSPFQCLTLGHHGLHRVGLRPRDFTGPAHRIPCAVAQKLFDDMAGSLSNGRNSGPRVRRIVGRVTA